MEEKFNYKETLNLPNTEFPMKANLGVKEPQTIEFWNSIGLYNLLKSRDTGNKKFVLHDGPPYANGDIHLGHSLNKLLKDFIIRYKNMNGFKSNYVPGWDCHGLPIEHKVLKELGKKAKDMSTLEIRKLCYDYALKWVDIQKEQFKRLGIEGEWENPYLTLDPKFEAGILETFRDLVKKDLIYKGLKPVHWCASCMTALAEAEVEHADHKSPSIYVKFPFIDKDAVPELKGYDNVFVVIWTTTPWTLPANLAITLSPVFEYCLLKNSDMNEYYIVAKELAESMAKTIGLKNYSIEMSINSADLENLNCKHPFLDRNSLILLGNHVTLEQGTGCVHTAPGHGMDDYIIGMKYNLPILVPVDAEGKFTNEFALMEGVNVWDANPKIIELLKQNGSLLFTENLKHSYPHCWRCKNPIIFRATEQWFMNVNTSGIKERALRAIDEEVEWIPRWGRDRIYNMVESRPDWCLSRQRSWGVPIPSFVCKDCGELLLTVKTLDFLIEIVKDKGTDAWFELDEQALMPKGTTCSKCGGSNFKKEKDILDVWFDSGSSHIACLEKRPDLSWPADMYLEGSDQHRGWFQTSLLTSIGARDLPPYKAVLTHGFTLDGEGKAMSKSLGNVISPLVIIDQLGADVLRLWVASEDYKEDVKLSNEIMQRMSDAYRRIRNTFRYILGNLSDYDVELSVVYQPQIIDYNDLTELDKWALHKTMNLFERATSAYDDFEFHKVFHLCNQFCTVEMSSFYLDILKDRLYTSGKRSKERMSAQYTLCNILMTLAKILAPIIPFTSEEVWQHLNDFKGKEKSIHLSSFPKVNPEWKNQEIEDKWDVVLKVREETAKILEAARRDKIIGHSLDADVVLINNDPESKLYKILDSLKDDLGMIFITSMCKFNPTDQTNIAPEKVKINDSELSIFVKKADGIKCERCWKISDNIGHDSTHTTICSSCVEVLKRGE